MYKIRPKTYELMISDRFNALLFEGASIYAFYDNKNDSNAEMINEESIDAAICRSLGISNGLTGNIPSLFFNGLSINRITDLDNPTFHGYDKIGEISCYHISGISTISKAERHLWIGENDYLIRKQLFKKESYITECYYSNIVINKNIPLKTFDWRPEKFKKL